MSGGERVWGVSLDAYVVYWIGLAVIAVIAVVGGLAAWVRNRGRR